MGNGQRLMEKFCQLTHHHPCGWSPALEKGGYTLGPLAHCLSMVSACHAIYPSLCKGGGPLRLRNGGGLAALGAAFSINSLCLGQMVSIGVRH